MTGRSEGFSGFGGTSEIDTVDSGEIPGNHSRSELLLKLIDNAFTSKESMVGDVVDTVLFIGGGTGIMSIVDAEEVEGEEEVPVNLPRRFSTSSGAIEEMEKLASKGVFDEVLGLLEMLKWL